MAQINRDESRNTTLEEVTNIEDIPITPIEKLRALKGAGARLYGPRSAEEIDADIREFRGNMPHPLNIASLRRITVACPSQWEGLTDDGRTLLIWYRYTKLSVSYINPDTSGIRRFLVEDIFEISLTQEGLAEGEVYDEDIIEFSSVRSILEKHRIIAVPNESPSKPRMRKMCEKQGSIGSRQCSTNTRPNQNSRA